MVGDKNYWERSRFVILYDVYVRILKAWGFSVGQELDIEADNLEDAGNQAKEKVVLDKGDKILEIEVRSLDKDEPITIFDAELNVTKEIQ